VVVDQSLYTLWDSGGSEGCQKAYPAQIFSGSSDTICSSDNKHRPTVSGFFGDYGDKSSGSFELVGSEAFKEAK
jgi:hypothetical protein